MSPHPTSFGVFKPVDHVLMALASAAAADSAARALIEVGFSAADITRFTPQVAESPDRGLDAQTPSGLEGAREIAAA